MALSFFRQVLKWDSLTLQILLQPYTECLLGAGCLTQRLQILCLILMIILQGMHSHPHVTGRESGVRKVRSLAQGHTDTWIWNSDPSLIPNLVQDSENYVLMAAHLYPLILETCLNIKINKNAQTLLPPAERSKCFGSVLAFSANDTGQKDQHDAVDGCHIYFPIPVLR